MTPQGHQHRMDSLSAFFKGEACVTDTLGPYVTAMPDEEMRIFLTTQLSDEARHTVFFARFFREVLGVERDTLEDTLKVTHDYLNAQLQYLRFPPHTLAVPTPLCFLPDPLLKPSK